jgi:hypothetical protein
MPKVKSGFIQYCSNSNNTIIIIIIINPVRVAGLNNPTVASLVIRSEDRGTHGTWSQRM